MLASAGPLPHLVGEKPDTHVDREKAPPQKTSAGTRSGVQRGRRRAPLREWDATARSACRGGVSHIAVPSTAAVRPGPSGGLIASRPCLRRARRRRLGARCAGARPAPLTGGHPVRRRCAAGARQPPGRLPRRTFSHDRETTNSYRPTTTLHRRPHRLHACHPSRRDPSPLPRRARCPAPRRSPLAPSRRPCPAASRVVSHRRFGCCRPLVFSFALTRVAPRRFVVRRCRCCCFLLSDPPSLLVLVLLCSFCFVVHLIYCLLPALCPQLLTTTN